MCCACPTTVATRGKNSIRNKTTALIQLLPPLLFTLLALAISEAYTPAVIPPAREMGPAGLDANYNKHAIFIAGGDVGGEELHKRIVQILPNTTLQQVEPVSNVGDSNLTSWLARRAGQTTQEVFAFNRETPLMFQVKESEDGPELTGWFNGQGYHSVSESLATVHSILIGLGDDQASIASSNAPLPQSDDEKQQNQQTEDIIQVCSSCEHYHINITTCHPKFTLLAIRIVAYRVFAQVRQLVLRRTDCPA